MKKIIIAAIIAATVIPAIAQDYNYRRQEQQQHWRHEQLERERYSPRERYIGNNDALLGIIAFGLVAGAIAARPEPVYVQPQPVYVPRPPVCYQVPVYDQYNRIIAYNQVCN